MFESTAETDLYQSLSGISGEVDGLISSRSYLAALEKMAGLKADVDRFFDEVMVMVDDDKIRNNRLNLLSELTGMFLRIADFSKIVA